MESLLRSIVSTLNNVEVRGKDNMDRLLGCIQALEQICDTLAQPQEPPTGENEEKE